MNKRELLCPWCGQYFFDPADLVDHMEWSSLAVHTPEDDVACLAILQKRDEWSREMGLPTDHEVEEQQKARARHPSSRR